MTMPQDVSHAPLAPTTRSSQTGVTLIVVLLILMVVTIVGIGGAQVALLAERSTRYDRDYLVASQAAEAALMDAEFDIRGPSPGGVPRIASFEPQNADMFIAGCGRGARNRGMCAPALAGVKPVWLTASFTDTTRDSPSVAFGEFTGRSFDAGDSGIKPFQAPRYIVEIVDDTREGLVASGVKQKMYRITAMGFGPRPDIQVVMQIAFRKETDLSP